MTSSFDQDMEGQYRKTRYSSLSFLQGVIYYFINIFLCFLEYFKIIYLYLFYSNEDLRSTLVYPSLKTVDIHSSCIIAIHQDPYSELYDVKGPFCEPDVDGGKNPSQQRETLPIPQVPNRLMNVWYGRLDGIMDPLLSKFVVWFALKLKNNKISWSKESKLIYPISQELV